MRPKSVKSMHCRKPMTASYRRNIVSKTNSTAEPKGHKDPEKEKKKVLASLRDGLTTGLVPFHF